MSIAEFEDFFARILTKIYEVQLDEHGLKKRVEIQCRNKLPFLKRIQLFAYLLFAF